MRYTFEELDLWRNGFAGIDHSVEKGRIIQAYRAFWDRTCELAKRIAADLPGLTLHDESHFLALWSRADQIAGPNYLLTPLELFVFGGAILLHDAAHTLSVYKGGLAELRETPFWQDTAAQMTSLAREDAERGASQLYRRRRRLLRLRVSAVNSVPTYSEPLEVDLQFNVLRRMHALKAEGLAFFSVLTPDSRSTYHLLEDDTFRTHLGNVIGLTAASHHWDINEIERKLPKKMGALAGFPSTWTIRPRVLACLLRCADATQVDQSRAPDFSYALLRGNKISETHWRAQNRLSQPYVQGDSLVFTSTTPFRRSDARAWWLASEALMVANRELEASNRLLLDLSEVSFAVRAIADADAPEKLRKYVQTEGWEPVPVGVAISDPKSVIKLLGGRLLYESDGLSVPLRELIQNASDAVRARRVLSDEDSSYSGKIVIEVESVDGNQSWISVRDNGIGMSPRVLTGALVDFGKSLWRSSDVIEELPGFARTSTEQSGRYGIGFFSLMMATNRATVGSKPYRGGQSEIRSIDFPDGLLGPCIMYAGSDVPIGDEFSTCIRILVDDDVIDEFLYVETEYDYDEDGNMADVDNIRLTWPARLKHMCLTVDCDIFFRSGSSTVKCHSTKWYDEPVAAWLESTELMDARRNSRYGAIFDFDQCIKAIRLLIENDIVRGRAAIIPEERGGIGNFVLHGFNTEDPSVAPYGPTRHFAGVLPVQPEGPRRLSETLDLQESTLSNWATDQASIWAIANLDDEDKHSIARQVCKFGGNAAAVANMPLNGTYGSLEEFGRILMSGRRIVFPKERKGSGFVDFIGSIDNDRNSFYRFEISDYFEPARDMDVCTARYGHSDEYYSISAESNISFAGMLRNTLSQSGYKLVIQTEEDYFIGRYKDTFHYMIEMSNLVIRKKKS